MLAESEAFVRFVRSTVLYCTGSVILFFIVQTLGLCTLDKHVSCSAASASLEEKREAKVTTKNSNGSCCVFFAL